MASHYEVLCNLINYQQEQTGSNIFVENGIAYSYGKHFPLMFALETGPHYLINADTRSVSTSKHQTYANRAAADMALAIPFSALELADIRAYDQNRSNLKDTLTVIEKQQGHWETRYCKNNTTSETEEYDYHTLGGALITYNPPGRNHKRYFISGIDESANNGQGYFLTELKKPANSLNEAYDQLKPPAIKSAEHDGKEITRQGEFFFIKITDEIPYFAESKIKKAFLLPTNNQHAQNHIARDAIKLPHKHLMVRGTVRHTSNQHRMLKLGENWWEVHHNYQRRSFNASGGYD